MTRYFIGLLCLLSLACSTVKTVSQAPSPPATDSFSNPIKAMQENPGFFTYYWEEKTGKIWLAVDQWDEEFLYVPSLAAGVGSNDIGLDRGQLGRERVVKFIRVGPKALLVELNYGFRAISDNPDERRAVNEAFAQSILGAFPIKTETNGKALIDLTPFLLTDAHGVANRLRRTGQGTYKLDANRSALYLPRTKSFPQNTEFEVILTFSGTPQGSYIREVSPSPEAVTVRQRHSFIQLPDDQYQPRKYDPRSGFFGTEFKDYATPIDQPLVKRVINRHRLQKKNPGPGPSEAIEPIVYYLDRGAPEPIRSALLEGANWWNDAFEAAGFINAFRVELMPEDADPMDVRYNVIQWVHRSTRGWSYGSSVSDPRTGEILKGHVSLGSLRVRQDFLIAQGLLAPYETGKPASTHMQEMALARLRQLSAHEVGHTIGLAHNFAASTNDRASVMDYPHPYITLGEDGQVDFSQAYDVGIGEWDKQAITYGYSEFASDANEAQELNKIIEKAYNTGLRYTTDQDARPFGSAHLQAHLWDNGASPMNELTRISKVRKHALSQFGEQNIPLGAPLATLEEVLVPLYFAHRYQVEAVSKVLGGMYYPYAMRGDNAQKMALVPATEQRAALNGMLETLTPEYLAIPERILALIPPHPPGYPRSRETFRLRTGSVLDPVSAAESAANHTLQLLLHPDRAARLVEFHARDNSLPGLAEVLDQLLNQTWKQTSESSYHMEIQRRVNERVLYHLMALASQEEAAGQVKAIALLKLFDLEAWLKGNIPAFTDTAQQAHFTFALTEIERFRRSPSSLSLPRPLPMPAGSPIGTTCRH